MDDHFTLGVNSNMDLIDNNINQPAHSLRNFNLSNVSSTHALSGNNFTVHHNHQRHHEHAGLPFIPLPHGTNNNNLSFDFSSDHIEAGPFYDQMTHFATTKDDTMIKRRSRDESLGNSNPPSFMISGENKTSRNNGHGGKRRKKNSEAAEVVEKPREVVHVRARRGEATDSHSLAERLRREKINGKLRCLQELVPGCYKTMGMSVMLDVTINYIRSLQSQIEFLSLKLSAASMFYDFNSAEMEALDAMRGSMNGYEADQVMERMGGEGYGDLLQFQSTTWPPT